MPSYLYPQSQKPTTEDLSAQVDGNTTVFNTTSNYDRQTLHVYYNGQRLLLSITIITSNQFALDFAPVAGSALFVDFFRE